MRKIRAATSVLLCTTLSGALAQTETIPVVRTNKDKLLLYNGGSKDDLNIRGKLPPSFSFSMPVARAGTACAVVSEKDSVSLFIQPGKIRRFYIVRDKDSTLCEVTGQVKPATFTQAYKKAHQGKFTTEVPEVYELVNTIFALTKRGQSDQNIVYQHSPYYQSVLRTFYAFRTHPAVLRMDSLLERGQYNPLKTDSYAFVFQGDKIINGEIYERVWGPENALLPHISLLEAFARKAKFRTFFAQNRAYYGHLRKDMETRVNLPQMKRWLEAQFPSIQYDHVKVIFSPLVSWNQSAAQFQDNGFKEAQLHINALHQGEWTKGKPENIVNAELSKIPFTELNHAYINPESEKHSLNTFKDLAKWTAGKASLDYQDQFSCFTEYLNWALVSLYLSDHHSADEFTPLKEGIERMMVNQRGFPKFKEFNEELLRLYKDRKPGTTVAELFTPLLAWAAEQ